MVLIGATLFDLEPFDPLTLAAVTGLVLLVAVLASRLPGRRAAQLDPMVALRHE